MGHKFDLLFVFSAINEHMPILTYAESLQHTCTQSNTNQDIGPLEINGFRWAIEKLDHDCVSLKLCHLQRLEK